MKLNNNYDYKVIKINNIPNVLKFIFALFPLLLMILIKNELDNDAYFIIPTGDYILCNGFPTKDFLSMHSNMDIIVQQWLSSVIFSFAYKMFGIMGVIAIVYIMFLVIYLLIFNLTKLISNNYILSLIISSVVMLLLTIMYLKTRPQIFTFAILLLVVFIMEKYVQNKKVKTLLPIPILSILLMNLHASMWYMIFIFMLPYLVGSLDINLKLFKQKSCCNTLPLVAIILISIVFGLINPYGIKSILYIFTSYGYEEINTFISEMKATDISSDFGIVFFFTLFISLSILTFSKNKQFTPRYVYMFVGTIILGFISQKTVVYYIVFGLISLSYFFKDFEPSIKIKQSKEETKPINIKTLVACSLLLVCILPVSFLLSNDTETANNEPESVYSQLDNCVDILNTTSESITLYTGFNLGQYMEFNGFHPYIDGRAELFLKDNNHEYDYLAEYNNLNKCKINYLDFINKYHFNYLIVQNEEYYLSNSLCNDQNYEIIYEGSNIKLFHQKGK